MTVIKQSGNLEKFGLMGLIIVPDRVRAFLPTMLLLICALLCAVREVIHDK